ncbi:unnamed protein product [Arctogadus glacialis]
MSVILDISYTVSIWISAAVAITYTLLGGLYSVAYTDVIQLILMFFSAWLCVPFVLMSPAASSVSNTTLDLNSTGYPPWLGTWEEDSILMKVDTFLFLAFGFLASQPIHQRILSARSSLTAKLSCYAAAVAFVVFAIPPALIGGVAVTAVRSVIASRLTKEMAVMVSGIEESGDWEWRLYGKVLQSESEDESGE